METKIFSKHQYGKAPYFIFCDHASNAIPEEYGGLGVSADVLQSHIAWDPGAADLALALAQRLEAPAVLSQFSRLLIDPNRALDQTGLIPECADQTPIPGNVAIPYAERGNRIDRFFAPYHEALDVELNAICDEAPATLQVFVISVHSFTPRMMGEYSDRPWHIGVLWRHDPQTATRMMTELRRSSDFTIGDNEPYDARVFNYTVDRHIAPRRLPHVTLEIRQDLLETAQAVADLADLFAATVRAVNGSVT